MPIVMARLVVIAVVAGVCALCVVLALHLFGLGEHAVIAAAVSASSSALVTSRSFRRVRVAG
ncbi:MAG: hypothetical protein ACKVW3_15425 [Phycisphaerales bacterium]